MGKIVRHNKRVTLAQIIGKRAPFNRFHDHSPYPLHPAVGAGPLCCEYTLAPAAQYDDW